MMIHFFLFCDVFILVCNVMMLFVIHIMFFFVFLSYVLRDEMVHCVVLCDENFGSSHNGTCLCLQSLIFFSYPLLSIRVRGMKS